MRLVITGPPGSGKGTQGELLSRSLAIPRYSTGDILRDGVRAGTELGRVAQRFMNAGNLVPDDVVLGIVGETLERPEAGRGFLLDGFPRTVPQAEGLERLLASRGLSLNAVIDLAVSDEEVVRRLSSRRVCEECGAVTRPKTEAGSLECSACGGRLVQRPDDAANTVLRRLSVYREHALPLLDWYRDAGVPVVVVDGIGEVEIVQERILSRLEN